MSSLAAMDQRFDRDDSLHESAAQMLPMLHVDSRRQPLSMKAVSPFLGKRSGEPTQLTEESAFYSGFSSSNDSPSSQQQEKAIKPIPTKLD